MRRFREVLVALASCIVVALLIHPVITNQSAAVEEKRASTAQARAVVNVTDFIKAGSPTGGIQEAIDTLPASGGVVTIPPGEYVLRQSIRVPTHVTLQGAGGSTVLRRAKQAESRLSVVAEHGQPSLRVKSVTPFCEGDEIGVWDRDSFGWNIAHAIVKEVQADELRLDRRLPRTYDPAKGGIVFACFNAITANEVSRIVIKDLAIDGRPANKPKEKSELDPGFTFAAIHLVDASDSRVEGCWITGWPSDGISMQRGGGNAVVRCRVQGCQGNGLHPGGGLHDSTISENVVRANGGDGMYFCAGVRHVVASSNVFAENKGNGIGSLGDNGDKYNVVANNICRANGGNGIWLFDGDNNTVTNNICINNSQSAPGQHCGIVLNQTADTIVSGNRCLDDQKTKTQKNGIIEFSSCRSNLIVNNLCRGNADAGLALGGKGSQRSANLD